MSEENVFTLKSIDSGWLELDVRSPGTDQVLHLRINSNKCEPLNEILFTLLELYRVSQDNDAPDKVSLYCFWEGDPWQYTWCFELGRSGGVDWTLLFCPDTYAGINVKEEVQLSSHSPLFDLLENFYVEMCRFLVEYGFCGYRTRWKKCEFPISAFFQLREIVEGCKPPENFREEMLALGNIASDF